MKERRWTTIIVSWRWQQRKGSCSDADLHFVGCLAYREMIINKLANQLLLHGGVVVSEY
jgi:hypothetical protein